jgi:hypothetical protein
VSKQAPIITKEDQTLIQKEEKGKCLKNYLRNLLEIILADFVNVF